MLVYNMLCTHFMRIHVCTCVFLINSSIYAGVHHVFLNNSFVFACCVHIGCVHVFINNSISAGVQHDVYTLTMCTCVFLINSMCWHTKWCVHIGGVYSYIHNNSISAGVQHAVYTLGVCTHVFLINSVSYGVQPAMYTENSSVLCFKQDGLLTCTFSICRDHTSDQSIIVDARSQSGHNCLTMTERDS